MQDGRCDCFDSLFRPDPVGYIVQNVRCRNKGQIQDSDIRECRILRSDSVR